ncbi:MAG TPA: DUF5671 domain-containing protein [Candidatus Nanopelagicaceae bacterium]
MMFAIGFILPVAIGVLIVLGIRKVRSGEAHGALQGHSVRRFFQYVILYGLIVVSGLGLSGLLGRVLERSTLVVSDQTDLARNLSFVVVGVPLYVFLALWTRRRFAVDPTEAQSFGWGFYVTLTSITSLSIGMFALHDMISWAFRVDDFRGAALARLIVWGAIWAVHWWVHLRTGISANARVHHALGSLISLGTVVVGVDQLISGAVQRLWDFGGDAIFVSHGDPILRGAVTLVVGAPIWYLYWVKNYSKSTRDPLWYAFVLLVGVGGGLVISVVSASTVLYSALVWLVGDPGTSSAATHFRSVPSAFGAVCVGAIAWWYHHAILEEDRKASRTEIQRIYEYLMAGIGLLAAAGGLAMILVALVEALTSSSVISGSGATNALLAAATLLVVGSPVWWIFWRRIQLAIAKFPSDEHSSPTRRVYLFILFGLGGIVAVVTLLVGVFFLFDDIFKGSFGLETIRRMRFAIAILITTGAIAGYHWIIYRSERVLLLAASRGPRLVILVGPVDVDLSRAISKLTGGRVQTWARTDGKVGSWNEAEVIHVLAESGEDALMLIADQAGMQTIPIERA